MLCAQGNPRQSRARESLAKSRTSQELGILKNGESSSRSLIDKLGYTSKIVLFNFKIAIDVKISQSWE